MGTREVLPVLLLVSDADGEVHQDDGDDDQGHSGDVEQPEPLLEECESPPPTAAVTTTSIAMSLFFSMQGRNVSCIYACDFLMAVTFPSIVFLAWIVTLYFFLVVLNTGL